MDFCKSYYTAECYISVMVTIFLISCHADNTQYRHLSRDNAKAGATETDVTLDNTKVVTLDNTKVVTLESLDNSLYGTVEQLQADVRTLQEQHQHDRKRIVALEALLQENHEETIISATETIQVRQLVSENFDKIVTLEELSQDNSVAIDSLQYTEKEARRDLRRFHEYKERAAKRFHQIENKLEKILKQEDENKIMFKTIHNKVINIEDKHKNLRNYTVTYLESLNYTVQNISQCCQGRLYDNMAANHNQQYSITNQVQDQTSNETSYSDTLTNNIAIDDFGGSGEYTDENLSKAEEQTNRIGLENLQKYSTNKQDNYETVELGSGEIIEEYESSGEMGSGEVGEELPTFVQMDVFMKIKHFEDEILKRDLVIVNLTKLYANLTDYVGKLETRLTSIQLGNFMQQLQESLINFTQNVITLDQWKISSNQLVNSTLHNEDKILRLTNMILANADKLSDMTWKITNAELLADQQFNILRMHVIRLNNTVEDIKDVMRRQTREKARDRSVPLNPRGSRQPDHGSHGEGLETLRSRLEDISLQIVYNQNRLGNLEVKVLNESLFQCRKYNMDAYQDSELAQHETIIKSNTNSILLTHELVKNIDEAVHTVNDNANVNSRRIRTVASNFDKLRGIIPVIIKMRKEIDHFRFQLPEDCHGYYTRGYRTSGVYVIHPVGAQRSIKVKCHMTSYGWTVIQQRFDGSLAFKQNWTAYRDGFGSANAEYWIGNEFLHLLTTNQNYSLQIDMTDIYNRNWSATYDHFSVADADNKYTISINGYRGNATNGMSYSNTMAFSTPDRDNDASGTHCAFYYEVGWWYKHCQTCNLNGRYHIGFVWFNLDHNDWIQLTRSVMRIKPG